MIRFGLLGLRGIVHHMVELTEEEFEIIYDALETVNDPFSNASVEEVILVERKAWKSIQVAKARYDDANISARLYRDLSIDDFPAL